MNLKELAVKEFNTFGDWLRNSNPTIFENSKALVWITNEGGFCTMIMMAKGKKISGRQYSKKLVIGYHNPKAGGWVVSEYLDKNYLAWVTTTKRLCGV